MLAGFSFGTPAVALPSGFYAPEFERRYLEPTNARNLQKHVEIYGIPYGVLGGVSHGLTFYVIICHLFGRMPLFPRKFLEKEHWNLAVVSLSSLVSIILSGITLARTRGSRPLMVLAGMQIVLGALVDIVHIHRIISKAQGWTNSMSLWTFPLLITSIFSVYAFYQLPCKRK